MSLFVLCNANSTVGYGHFFRCLYLANEWQKSCAGAIEWVGDIDKHLHPYCSSVTEKNWEDALAYICTKAPSTVICDSYLLNDSNVDALAACHKVIVIDDFGESQFYAATAVVNFTVAAERYSYAAAHTLLGPRYFLCHPSLDSVRSSKLSLPASESTFNLSSANILIAMGGFDRHQIGRALALFLGKSLPAATITLLGKYDDASSAMLTRNVNVLSHTNRMDTLYQKADLVISGGGLIKYESAYCGVLNIVLAQTEEQLKESHEFKALGLCVPYGMAQNLLSYSNKKETNSRETDSDNHLFDDSLEDFLLWLKETDFERLESCLRHSSLNVFSAKSTSLTAKRLLTLLGME